VRTIRTVAELRAALTGARHEERSIALVPTMGAFHAGHAALMRRAHALCDVVVVSLFVNPSQFGAGEDLTRYPRDEARDAELAAEQDVDLLFAPPPAEVYPDGFATTVSVAGGLTDGLCAGPRGAEHFSGVATIVLKLLNMTRPDVVVLGQKDAQQAAVIRRLVADLNLAVRVDLHPIVREADGLAMSSRNAYLTPADRPHALALSRALAAAEEQVAAGRADAEHVTAAARGALDADGVEPEYVELVAPTSLRPAASVNGETLLAVAARVGSARLIDNVLLHGHSPLNPDPEARRPMQRTMLNSKIHRATVTGSDLHYVGSITIDADLLAAADIREHEQVHVVDVDNGARFETYTIAGSPGSGQICINGAAARLVHTGDTVIVISYAVYDEAELHGYEPQVVHVDRANRIVNVDAEVATLLS